MKSDFRKAFYQGIQHWKQKNPQKRTSEISRDTVMAVLLNTAKKVIHPRTVWSDVPVSLAERVYLCMVTGIGPRYVLDEIYETMTTPVNWNSFKMGILA
jgi:hypothetical protein